LAETKEGSENGAGKPEKEQMKRTLLITLILTLFFPTFVASEPCHSPPLSSFNQVGGQGYIEGMIAAEAQVYGLDPAIFRGLVEVESSFNPNHVGAVGERGLGQLRPTTAKWLCKKMGLPYRKDELFEVDYNLQLSAFYLRWLLNWENGDWSKTLGSYNAGPGHRSPKYVDKVMRYAKGQL
jgi:soluble lytic murein transglycosylase-like protein